MQSKPCSLFPDAWDIPRAGNFPGLKMLMGTQTLAKAWREMKEKLLNNPMQSNGYDHWTQEELGSSVGSDTASLSDIGQFTSFPLLPLPQGLPGTTSSMPHVYRTQCDGPQPLPEPMVTTGPQSCWQVSVPAPLSP